MWSFGYLYKKGIVGITKKQSRLPLQMAKILTFVYSLIMAAVAVGIAIQIANDFSHPIEPSDDYPDDDPDQPEVVTKPSQGTANMILQLQTPISVYETIF